MLQYQQHMHCQCIVLPIPVMLDSADAFTDRFSSWYPHGTISFLRGLAAETLGLYVFFFHALKLLPNLVIHLYNI